MEPEDFDVSIYYELSKVEDKTVDVANFAAQRKVNAPLAQMRKKRLSKMSEESKSMLSRFAEAREKSDLKGFYIVWKREDKVWNIKGFSAFREEQSEVISQGDQ